jgi:hypothetical protein
MKNKSLDIKLEWVTSLNPYVSYEQITDYPSFNVKIYDKNNSLIKSSENLKDYISIIDKSFTFPENAKKLKFNKDEIKNKAKTNFTFLFEDNYLKYKINNNKLGFYDSLNVQIDYNNLDQYNLNLNVDYDIIEDLNKQLLFNKVYRSNDYFSVKLLINKEYNDQKEINSLLIFPEASNKITKNQKLKNLFVEDLSSKWLDMNSTVALLTVPFIESEIVEISENINIKILPLTKWQTQMYSFLIKKEDENEVNKFLFELLDKQIINIGKIYKQSINYETVIFYQNYIYLFNKDSLENNSLKNDLILDNVNFNYYFPLLNKNLANKTICLSNDLNTDNVLDTNYPIDSEYLGFYSKDLSAFEDVKIDLDYFQAKNIKNVKILEIEEDKDNDLVNIYIEYITEFYDNEKFYIETSNNLNFYEKYKTKIDEKDHITFLLKYSYSSKDLNNYLEQNKDTNKSQIISNKDLINFSAKLIL